MKRLVLACSIAIIISVGFCLLSTAQSQIEIRINGAASMYPRIKAICNQYMKEHPNVKIDIAKDKLVHEGIFALIDRDADIAMAPRSLLKDEVEAAKAKGIVLDEHLIGFGGIVIITHPSNPINEITLEQIKKLFTGEYTNWKELGGKDQKITLLKSGPLNPGTMIFFEQEILKGASISEKAISNPDFRTIIMKTSEMTSAVGYTRIRDAQESEDIGKSRFKQLKIKKDENSKAVAPSRETIQDGSYPIRRPYFLVTKSDANEDIKSVVHFIVSKGWGKQQWR